MIFRSMDASTVSLQYRANSLLFFNDDGETRRSFVDQDDMSRIS